MKVPAYKLPSDTHSTADEKHKYEKCHQIVNGYKAANHLVKWLPKIYQLMNPVGSVVELGAGNGHALEKMAQQGLAVIGLDIASNCGMFAMAEKYPAISAYQGCLWEPWPQGAQADYFATADVMEHIPPENIDSVMLRIKENVKLGGFMQVCSVVDSSGKYYFGTPLHLTIEGEEWWERKLMQHFSRVRKIHGGSGQPNFWVDV